jgi:hypothetical protein
MLPSAWDSLYRVRRTGRKIMSEDLGWRLFSFDVITDTHLCVANP